MKNYTGSVTVCLGWLCQRAGNTEVRMYSPAETGRRGPHLSDGYTPKGWFSDP